MYFKILEGTDIALSDVSDFNGEPAYILEVHQAFALTHFYISTDSYRMLGSEKISAEGRTATTYEAYQLNNGVYIPTVSVIESEGTGHSIITTESIEIGVGIYEEYFEYTPSHQTAHTR
ncbi:MAG: hypothetical protein ACPGGN_00830 [Opitutales bacterium]